jgi:hypothetical protein
MQQRRERKERRESQVEVLYDTRRLMRENVQKQIHLKDWDWIFFPKSNNKGPYLHSDMFFRPQRMLHDQVGTWK